MRRIEFWLGLIGAILSVVFLGGFTFLINQVSLAEFETIFSNVFGDVIDSLGVAGAYEFFKTLGAWFGFTLLAVLIFIALATLFIKYRNYRKRAGVMYLLAGLVCLLGSQLFAYPIAFFFFVAGVLCFLRKVDEEGVVTT